MTAAAPASPEARVLSINVAPLFESAKDNQLTATIEVENPSQFTHSCQVVFRGYVRRQNELLYEFLHEQQWIVVNPSSTETQDISVDVWLPRFPPSGPVMQDLAIEYSVKATVDPWFENHHMEQKFDVSRTLVLKMPHAACFAKQWIVNECIGHRKGIFHKKCVPLNGEVWTDKGAYTYGEQIRVRWTLHHDESKLDHVKLSLVKLLEYRISDPSHPMMMEKHNTIVATRQVKADGKSNECTLEVPHKLPVTMAMTLWNVLTINYELQIQVKVANQKDYVELSYPIIICSEAVEAHEFNPNQRHHSELFRRAQDVDDDSEDDDDYDSEVEHEDPQVRRKMREDKDYSVDIEKLKVLPGEGSNGLKEADALVDFSINSNEPKPLGSVRLLLQGEARAGSHWYEFVRFKAIVTSDEKSQFSPGKHQVKIALPFRDSQYDVNILPPTLGDDIRYVCMASGDSWRKNIVPKETNLMVDRYTDTWGRAEFKPPYSEQKGAVLIKMRQRNFQRGKFVLVQVEGKVRKLQLQLVQQIRLRVPGLKQQDSYCHERIVSVEESPSDQNQWPTEWAVPIPPNIPPSIEVSYWNVLFLSYEAVVVVTLEDGHDHKHRVPIWIGCSDDNMERLPNTRPPAPNGLTGGREPDLGELPPFEVVHPEEVREQPYWVERFNDHTYGYMS